MRIITCSLLFVLAIFSLQGTNAKTDKVVCYFGSWSTYRFGNGKFDVENIDPSLCTHLIYTFVGLLPDATIRSLDDFNDLEENWGKGAFKRFNELRNQSPGTKTLIAIGGWNEGSTIYSQVMADDYLRARFVSNAVNFVMKYGFDGFDLDWEYPNQRDGEYRDIENFSKLIRELRVEFDRHGLLLTAAVAAAEFSVSQSYNIPALSKYLDFINVMTYDLHGPWDKVTGQNAPMNPSAKDVTEMQRSLNVKSCIEAWINGGADPAKIILGMGTYGRSFTLDNSNENGVGASAENPGNGGPYTNQPGMMGFNEIIELQNKGGWTVVWDDEQQVPYMYKGNQWVGYDNPTSIAIKMEYAKKMGLGGGMIWSVETDDFKGLSGTKFAILRAINTAIGNTNPAPIPTTPKPGHSTAKPIDPSYCRKEGFIRDPKECAIFYYCEKISENEYKTNGFRCQDGLYFDLKSLTCNYAHETDCVNRDF